MIFTESPLSGAYIIERSPIEDERGYFCRTWCKKEFLKRNLNISIVQCNLSYNKKGTLRRMHIQREPYGEVKVVSCINGAIYDVITDLRPESATYKEWFSIILSNDNKKMLYVPEGFAHGFQTLEDDTTVFYQMSEFYYPAFADGVRYNDRAFDIKWPIYEKLTISERDKNYGDFK